MTTSPCRTVVPAHCGSARLVDATYLGRLFSAAAIGFVLGSAIAPQEPAKISYVRRPKRNAGRAAVDLVEIVPGFGVEKWYGPSAALEAAAAILVRSAQPLHHAVHRDVGRGRQPHVLVTSLNNRRGPFLDPRYSLKTSTLRSAYQWGVPRRAYSGL